MKMYILNTLLVLSSATVSFADTSIKGTTAIANTKENQFPSLAKIDTAAAAKAALNEASGQLLSIGLENEAGFLVYEVKVIGTDSNLHEILVDAGNGQILSNQKKSTKHVHSEETEDGDDD